MPSPRTFSRALGNPSPLLLSQLLATAGLIPIPRVLLILGCHINGITISLVLLLHVEITFNLLIVLLNVPLGAEFSSFPQVEVNLIFFFLIYLSLYPMQESPLPRF